MIHLGALAAIAVFDNPWSALINSLASVVSSVLDYIFAHVLHNYGWSMVALAFVATLVLLPLYLQTFRSVKEMQAIQPYVKRLQEKYKGDRQKFAEEQMKLFREHNINPFGGCLPMLIQIPIMFSIYTAIRSHAPQFAHATWLWIGSALSAHPLVFPAWIPFHLLSGALIAANLSQPDPLITLLYSISMFFSFQMSTGMTTDPMQQQQQRMMAYMMPALWFFVGQHWPSGFVLYWFSTNAFSTTIRVLAMRTPSRIPSPPKETPATLAGYPLNCPKCDALLSVVKGSKCASCGTKVKKLAPAANGQAKPGTTVAPADQSK